MADEKNQASSQAPRPMFGPGGPGGRGGPGGMNARIMREKPKDVRGTVRKLMKDSRRRAEKGLLAGLWEFPSLPGRQSEEALRALYPDALSIRSCGEARHAFTHVEWHMTGFRVELPREPEGYVWADAGEIRSRYSVPTALKYYLKQL